MRVAVIDSVGMLIATGEWDGRRIDGEFARINGELYHCAYVYDDEDAEKVTTLLKASHQDVKDAEKHHMDTLMMVGNLYRARSK